MRLKELITLLPVALGNIPVLLGMKVWELFSLGAHGWWWKLNTRLFLTYMADPPHRIVARNLPLVHSPGGSLIYGETPCATFEKMLRRVSPGESDFFVDLGSGRGVPCFCAHFLHGIPSLGIDIIPEFIARARSIGRALDIRDVEFINEDFLKIDLARGTIFYIAGTTFEHDTLVKLSRKLEEIPGTLRVISLSCGLPSPRLKTVAVEEYWFTWGKSHVYFQVKT